MIFGGEGQTLMLQYTNIVLVVASCFCVVCSLRGVNLWFVRLALGIAQLWRFCHHDMACDIGESWGGLAVGGATTVPAQIYLCACAWPYWDYGCSCSLEISSMAIATCASCYCLVSTHQAVQGTEWDLCPVVVFYCVLVCMCVCPWTMLALWGSSSVC